MAVKSMPSPGSIQGWPLESILKRLETAFLCEHTVESIASLCNNGVKLILEMMIIEGNKQEGQSLNDPAPIFTFGLLFRQLKHSR